MKIIRRAKARINKVPFAIEKHWPPFYQVFYPDRTMSGCKVCAFTLDKKPGDEVNVLENKGVLYVYKITSVSYAPGNDHIVSPKQFNLEYMRTVSA